MTSSSSNETNPRLTHRFFVGLGVWCMLLAVLGFGPNVYGHFRGELFFPPIVLLHGAIMMAWLALYTAQASFAARGNLRRHRRVGWTTAALSVVIWLSMGVAQITALQRYDPNQFGFILQPMLVGIGSIVVFPVFVIGAISARRHTGWHKRLMTFATFVLLQAALDRMHWLPNEGLPMFWHNGVRLYVLLFLPLFAWDLVTLRRLHPATWMSSALIVAMHGVVSFYWNHPAWNQLGRGIWLWLRQTN